MTTVEFVPAMAFFQQLHSFDGVQISSVCNTSPVDLSQNVHPPHAARIVIVTLVEGLDKQATVLFNADAQKATWTTNLTYLCQHFSVRIAVRVQEVSLNSSSKVIRHRMVAFKGFLW